MTALLLGMLGWCLVSVVAAAAWATVCAGARRGAALNVPAWQAQPVAAVRRPVAVPAPRAAAAEQPVAV